MLAATITVPYQSERVSYVLGNSSRTRPLRLKRKPKKFIDEDEFKKLNQKVPPTVKQAVHVSPRTSRKYFNNDMTEIWDAIEDEESYSNLKKNKIYKDEDDPRMDAALTMLRLSEVPRLGTFTDYYPVEENVEKDSHEKLVD